MRPCAAVGSAASRSFSSTLAVHPSDTSTSVDEVSRPFTQPCLATPGGTVSRRPARIRASTPKVTRLVPQRSGRRRRLQYHESVAVSWAVLRVLLRPRRRCRLGQPSASTSPVSLRSPATCAAAFASSRPRPSLKLLRWEAGAYGAMAR